MPSEKIEAIIKPEDLNLAREFHPSEDEVIEVIKKGKKLNYIMTQEKIIFTTGMQEGLLESLHLTKANCRLSDGDFQLRAGYLVFGNPEHKGKHNLGDLNLIAGAARAIKQWLKEKGVEYK